MPLSMTPTRTPSPRSPSALCAMSAPVIARAVSRSVVADGARSFEPGMNTRGHDASRTMGTTGWMDFTPGSARRRSALS